MEKQNPHLKNVTPLTAQGTFSNDDYYRNNSGGNSPLKQLPGLEKYTLANIELMARIKA